MSKAKRNIKPRTPPKLTMTDDDVSDEKEEAKFEFKKQDRDDDYFNDEASEAEAKARQKRKKAEKAAKEALPRGTDRTTTVKLDKGDRKLSKKHKSDLAGWSGNYKQRAGLIDAYLRGQVDTAKVKTGSRSVFVGEGAGELVFGIPMFGGHDENAHEHPGCLPLEYVIVQDCYPLGLVLQLLGLPGVGKSAFLAELGRFFSLAGGVFDLKEVESKLNHLWYRSILLEHYARLRIEKCGSLEDWQRAMTDSFKHAQAFMLGTAESPGPGRVLPFLFGVDSVMGKQSEETAEKILGAKNKKGVRGVGDGAANRGFPIEAQKLTRYLKTISGEMDMWPISIALVNHLRISLDDMGHDKRVIGGGELLKFQESFELELTRLGGNKNMSCREWTGYKVRIKCYKNSFGPGDRSVTTRLIWWEEEDPETGAWHQVTHWDWDWSTIWLLNFILKDANADVRTRAILKESGFHLDCPSVSDIENRAWSKTLGMTAKDAAPWSEVGAMIRQNPKVQNQLRDALRIVHRPLLDGDYLRQLNAKADRSI